jgi:hypothetical protein
MVTVTKKELLKWLDKVLDDSVAGIQIETNGKVETHFIYGTTSPFPISRYRVSWDEIRIKQLGGFKGVDLDGVKR